MEPAPETQQPNAQSSQDYSTRIFLFALELIPYFGLPAMIGLFANRYIQETYPNLEIPVTAIIFLVTYTLSWVLVIKRYRSIKRQLKK